MDNIRKRHPARWFVASAWYGVGMVVAITVSATSLAEPAGGLTDTNAVLRSARTVRFPETLSMGKLFVRDERSTDPDAWDLLGEAQGAVKVPAGMDLMFKVGEESPDDLSPLAKFDAGDLQVLDLSRALAFRTHEGTALNDPSATDWNLAYIKGLTSLWKLNLAHTNVTNEGLAHLKELNSLQSLNLRRTSIGDTGLAHLAGLTEMRELRLAKTRVHGTGLAHLKNMKSLRLLDLTGIWIGYEVRVIYFPIPPHGRGTRGEIRKIDDGGLKHLEDLKEIRYVDLARLKIGNDDLAYLKGMRKLEALYLNHNRGITNEALDQIASLKSLRTLSLSSTGVTSCGTVALQRLPALEHLSLRNTRPRSNSSQLPPPRALDAQSIQHLATLGNLKSLDLRGVKVEPQAIDGLRAALPNTDVKWP